MERKEQDAQPKRALKTMQWACRLRKTNKKSTLIQVHPRSSSRRAGTYGRIKVHRVFLPVLSYINESNQQAGTPETKDGWSR